MIGEMYFAHRGKQHFLDRCYNLLFVKDFINFYFVCLNCIYIDKIPKLFLTPDKNKKHAAFLIRNVIFSQQKRVEGSVETRVNWKSNTISFFNFTA